MKERSNQAILITGTSSGIGYSCVLILAQKGFKVFAGVRTKEDAEKLSAIGDNVFPVIIDITLQDTIQEAYRYIQANLNNEIFSLVNNAGIAVACPMESITLERLEKQFDVNVMGHIRLIQQFMPLIRKTKGKIINISSIFGVLPLPYTAPYCSSKAALDALSVGLRLELKKWGIEVITVKPGIVKTPIWQKSCDQAAEKFQLLNEELYCYYGEEFTTLTSISSKFSKFGSNPDKVARVISKILLSPKSKPVYLVGKDAFVINVIRKFPQFIVDKIVSLLISIGLKYK